LLHVTLGNPLEKGLRKRGLSPELLCAGAYSARCHGALSNAAKKFVLAAGDSTVRALVSLIEEDEGDFLPLELTMSTSMLFELLEWATFVVFGGGLDLQTHQVVRRRLQRGQHTRATSISQSKANPQGFSPQ